MTIGASIQRERKIRSTEILAAFMNRRQTGLRNPPLTVFMWTRRWRHRLSIPPSACRW